MAALRAAVFPLSAKNRRGGHFLPPSSARVNPRPVRGGLMQPPPMSFSELDATPFRESR